ncbi:unnamed protein product [Parascedosporium putredinis]|uniref:Pentatricopeptide repeat protein n=1 Tax=Parascedosporium putredinis TaxID=1442378 RepID=A0A9P1GWX0_9PEZI|nr:unnamed protein product [Parascedosporium putredinis]CAI7989270.1 unnamed protein product [Parascedosporium putredinis]
MLARQHCVRQACRSGFASAIAHRPLRLAAIAPGRGIVTAAKTRKQVGVAGILDVNNTPTIVPIKDSTQLDKAQLKNLTVEYNYGLQDPWKLSNAVISRLRRDRLAEAQGLVRIASKDMQVPASWNQLIDYQLKHQRLHAALKLFNEMKKRGQLPNAHTYTTLFKGCARSEHAKLAVAEAVKLYMTMLNSSRIPPNVIHLNAALEVCARALDVDAMMSVAATIDNKTRKPDALTYSTILNGLRAWVEHQGENLKHAEKTGYTEEDHKNTIAKTLEQARRIWQEVIRKSNSAQIVLDEGLVFSMDNQTRGPFLPLPTPTTRTLSLILYALDRTRRARLALHYWTCLVEDYGITPDQNNWHALLRILRRTHSSAQTVAALKAMPTEFMTPKTFRVALETCVHDNVNPNATKNAAAIYDIMVTALPEPDLESIRLYVDVAAKSSHQFRLMRRKAGADPAARAAIDRAYALQVLGAIDHIWMPGGFATCRNEMMTLLEAASRPGPDASTSAQRAHAANYCMEVVATCRKIVSAWDRVITEAMLDEDQLDGPRRRRDLLNRFVANFYEPGHQGSGDGQPGADARTDGHAQGYQDRSGAAAVLARAVEVVPGVLPRAAETILARIDPKIATGAPLPRS